MILYKPRSERNLTKLKINNVYDLQYIPPRRDHKIFFIDRERVFVIWLLVGFFFLFKYSVDEVKVTHQLLVHFCFDISCKSEKCL